MINAVMLVRDRPALTQQALISFVQHTKLEWTLTIVDDGSGFTTQRVIATIVQRSPNMCVLRSHVPVGVTGKMRNLGVYWSEKMWGRGDFLYLSDNDAYFTPGWDAKLAQSLMDYNKVKLVGPYRHPYHKPKGLEITVGLPGYVFTETDAVQGLGHLMLWETWDKYGPLDAHAVGTNQSEDFKFCQDIVKDGFLVGSIQPDVVWNCGLTGTNGRPSPGAEVLERHKGVLML